MHSNALCWQLDAWR